MPMNSGSLVECVPNFSEGRNAEVVRQIAGAITAIEAGLRAGYAHRSRSQSLSHHFRRAA